MPPSDHFVIKGRSPYKQKNGIFEVEFAIAEAKPSALRLTKIPTCCPNPAEAASLGPRGWSRILPKAPPAT